MAKYFLTGLLVILSSVCYAQEDIEDFFSDLVEDKKAEEKNQEQEKELTARKVFQMAPKKDILPEIKAPKIDYTENVVMKKTGIERESAPFGLYWGLSLRETEEYGVYLRPYTKNNEVTAYEATGLPKPIKDFAVVVDFGDTDELWKITAYSTPQKDDGKASKVVELYKKFYNLLEKKYGVAKENVSDAPNIMMGDDGYLEALKNKEAKASASFNSGSVIANIEIKALQDDHTFMILEYISKKITRAREEDILDAL